MSGLNYVNLSFDFLGLQNNDEGTLRTTVCLFKFRFPRPLITKGVRLTVLIHEEIPDSGTPHVRQF